MRKATGRITMTDKNTDPLPRKCGIMSPHHGTTGMGMDMPSRPPRIAGI
jgi:hypothetical protein